MSPRRARQLILSAVCAGVVFLSACGSGGERRPDPNHLSASETERIIDDQVTIGQHCRGSRFQGPVAAAVSDLLALYRRGPQRSYSVGPGAPRPSVRSIVQIERRQLARCGRGTQARRLGRALHGA